MFVIRPSEPLTIGRMEHDPERVRAVYDIGVADAEREIEKLKNWLAEG